MPFREKSAWISLFAVLFVTLIYAAHFPWSLTPPRSPALLHGLIHCVVLLIVIEVVAHIIIGIMSPREATAPIDEREKLIELKAVYVAAHVFGVGTFAALSTLFFGANEVALAYAVLLAFVIAELVNYGARIVYYRRGV